MLFTYGVREKGNTEGSLISIPIEQCVEQADIMKIFESIKYI